MTAQSETRRPFRQAARGAATILGASVLMLLSWNLFAPELLGVQGVTGKEALGATLFLALAGWLLRGPFGKWRRE